MTYFFHQLTNFCSQVGAKDIGNDTAQTLHVFNLFKALSYISVPFVANFPAVRTSSLPTVGSSILMNSFLQGVVVYLVTGVVAMTAQSIILRAPSIRKALDIPRIPDNTRVTPPTFLESVKFGVDWFKNKSAEAQAQQRAQERKKF